METNRMEANEASHLQGFRVAMLMTDGVEQIEYTSPRKFLERHGAEVTLIAPKAKGDQVQGFNHLVPGERFQVELDVRDARSGDFDALVLPGGVANPDQLRMKQDVIALIRAFQRESKPIAAICHGLWPLIDAGIVVARRVTSWPSLREDLRNAGAHWTDEPVVVDGTLITSRKPDDLPAFNRALMQALARVPERELAAMA